MPTGTWFNTHDSLSRPAWDDAEAGMLVAPANVSSVYTGPSSAKFVWSHPDPQTGFKTYRGLMTTSWELMNTLPAGTYEDEITGLAIGKPTYFCVAAFKDGIESAKAPSWGAWQNAIINAIGGDDTVLPSEFPITITGMADQNQPVEVSSNGVAKNVVADGSGVWSVVFTYEEIGAGSKSVIATIVIPDGYGPRSRTRLYTVGPPAPVILGADANPSVPGQRTIYGTAIIGASMTLFSNSVLLSNSLVPDVNGNWAFTTNLAPGQYTIYATQTLNGLVSSPSSNLVLTVAVEPTDPPIDPPAPPPDTPPPPESPPPPAPPAGRAMTILGSREEMVTGTSRVFTIQWDEAPETYEVESSEPGTVKAFVSAGGFTLVVHGGGAEQVTIYIRAPGFAPASITLKITPAFVATASIVVSGDQNVLGALRRR